jgi:nitrate reductase delta subunit
MSLFPSRHPALLLRALSALLAYPDAAIRAALPEIIDAVNASRAIGKKHKEGLIALAESIQAQEPLKAEAYYVEMFDRGRRTSLDLFEHVYQDGRKRGPAMLELRERYHNAGMEPASDELPDHLPMLLEYLSCRNKSEIRETLTEAAHIFRKIGNTLMKRDSPYAAVMSALLAVAHESGLDADAPTPPPEDIDALWKEQPAFGKPRKKTAVERVTT